MFCKKTLIVLSSDPLFLYPIHFDLSWVYTCTDYAGAQSEQETLQEGLQEAHNGREEEQKMRHYASCGDPKMALVASSMTTKKHCV